MNYEIWLQILMELALAVGGEQDINLLLEKACQGFHRKLDCTHITIYEENNLALITKYVSPKWVDEDIEFIKRSKELNLDIFDNNQYYSSKKTEAYYHYALKLKGYGSISIACSQELSVELIHELEPILDMFATNILACVSLSRQIQVEQEIRAQKAYTEHFAYHDSLTNLPNRRKFMEALTDSLDKEEYGGMLLLDLDNFKGINDTLGHSYGDQVLIHIGEELRHFENESVMISRFGGDEFQFLFIEKERDEIEAIINGIFKKLSKLHNISGHNVEISFSAGITIYPEDTMDASRLLTNADMAMYSVKNSGKNGFRFFDNDLSSHLLRKQFVEKAMNDAIRNDGFQVVYQPQVNCISGCVIGYEALLRLKCEDISPSEFIPIAEKNKSIIKIGRIVTKKVVEQLRRWKNQGIDIKPVSINFSASQIYDFSFFNYLMGMLEVYEIDPSLIEIEITETIFIDNRQRAVELLDQFRAEGIRIAIDDFGTGYSSLSYLTFLPIDKLKLDRSIIVEFLEFETSSFVESLISLAHSLGLEVIAEGVETQEQFRLLQTIECDYIQGFYFSKSLDIEEICDTFSRIYIDDQTKYSCL